MQSFKPLWAVRPDYLSPMAKALAAGEYVGPDNPDVMIGRVKRFAIIDALPKECRAWIHENGSANLLRNWQRGERSAKKLIREGEKWIEQRKPYHSVCLNDPVADATALLDDLGL